MPNDEGMGLKGPQRPDKSWTTGNPNTDSGLMPPSASGTRLSTLFPRCVW